MSILEKRKERVQRLTNQALQDRLPHKYIQGRFILSEIDKRMAGNEAYRTIFIQKLRNEAKKANQAYV